MSLRADTVSRVLPVAVASLPFAGLILSPVQVQWVYYSGLLLTAFVLIGMSILRREKLGVDWCTVAFLLVCVLSLCFNDDSWRFMAWQRLAVFVLMMTAVGPLISGKTLIAERHRVLSATGWLCVLCSFYYNGLYLFMLTHYCAWMSRWQWIFSHSILISMLFSGLSAVGGLFMAWRLLNMWRRGEDTRVKHRIKVVAAGFCFLVSANALILESSRSALIGFAIALVAMCVYFRLRKGSIPIAGEIGVVVLVCFMVLSVVIPMTPLMSIKLNHVEKNNDDYLASRRDLWGERAAEIEKWHLFGTGFACVADESPHSCKSHPLLKDELPESAKSRIEPGSGWLYVFSSTGIFGLLLFILITVRALWNAYRSNGMLFGLLIFMYFQMMAEGYVLASGSTICFIFWLIVACATPYKQVNIWHRIKKIYRSHHLYICRSHR